MKIDIGINEKQRKAIALGLSHFLADSYTLYLKTHNYHWNVTGPHFASLHVMFEGQYTELALAVDEIAERIRALGIKAPGSYKEFSKLTKINEADSKDITAKEMVQDLVKGHEAVVKTAREVFSLAEDANDQPTVDLLTRRMDLHEKSAWMLRSFLE